MTSKMDRGLLNTGTMKRTVSSRKSLKLAKQTIRNLSESDLHNARGGKVATLCTLLQSACSSIYEPDTLCHPK